MAHQVPRGTQGGIAEHGDECTIQTKHWRQPSKLGVGHALGHDERCHRYSCQQIGLQAHRDAVISCTRLEDAAELCDFQARDKARDKWGEKLTMMYCLIL